MSIFTGLETARRALMSQQLALNTTNHNIANANTPGFSRQEAVFGTTPAYTLGYSLAGKAMDMGTGVQIEDIRRLRDTFLDFQFRSEVKEEGRWEVRREILEKLEVVINEPSEGGLAVVLEGFFDSWQELSQNPESRTVRSVVLQQGIALTDTLNHLDMQLEQLRQDLNQTLLVHVTEINSLGQQIADLNAQVIRAEARGQRANDLRDTRDLLVDKLAKLTGVHTTESENGALNVVIANRGLVEGTRSITLDTTGSVEHSNLAPVWSDGQDFHVHSGALKGIEEAREIVETFQANLDTLVDELSKAVNGIHAAGYGLDALDLAPEDAYEGRNFFISADEDVPGILPGNIIINPALIANPDLIAAATDIAELPGDGSLALKLAQLRHKPIMGGLKSGEGAGDEGEGALTTTLSDYYNSLVADLGIRSREAQRMAHNQGIVTGAIERQREMASGVSLDEEITDMIRFQHAYNAAARMITAIDEMLDVIVNRMGIVGR